MKWRNIDYDVQYAVRRICRELGADPVEVWEIVDQEFDKEPGETFTPEEAADLAEIVLASLRAELQAAEKTKPDEYLTRHQAAALLNVHVVTIDRLIHSGRLSYSQVVPKGRIIIPRKAVHELIRKSMHKALPERCYKETYRNRRVV